MHVISGRCKTDYQLFCNAVARSRIWRRWLVEELEKERPAKGPFEFLKVAVANPNLGN